MADLVARLLISSAFLVSGLLKLVDFPSAVREVATLTGFDRMAAPMAVAVILVQLGGAALILSGGRRVVPGAILLGGFTIVATVAAHAFWSARSQDPQRDLMTFLEHAGLVGAFLVVALAARREQRA